MMIEVFDGKTPKIADSAYVHPSARVMGDVEVGEHAIVWPGAVVRADSGKIKIGRYVLVEDNCVLHSGSVQEDRADIYSLMDIGDYVILGHGAVFHGRCVGLGTLIGMNACVLENVEVGAGCIIAAGAVITAGKRIAEGSMVTGVPGKVKSAASPGTLRQWIDDREAYCIEMIEKMKAMRAIE